jgi:NHLM bacteriocin system ABC transporter peptidase/ATP-binding protein
MDRNWNAGNGDWYGTSPAGQVTFHTILSKVRARGAGGDGTRTNVRRVRTPTVLQMEATECGAASLGMILGYHGLWIPLEVLRVSCGVSRDGSKAKNIVIAARRYGMITKGWRKDLNQLATLPAPFIVFWKFNHFLVVEGIDYRRRQVWVNDPNSGPRRISLEEFDEGFTGVCLTFEPGPGFRPAGQPPKLRRSLRPRLRGSETTLAYIGLVSILLVIPGIAIPAFGKAFVDSVLIAGNQRWLIPLAIGLGLTAILRGALAWMQQIQLARLETRLALTQMTGFFWHVLRLPMAFYSQRHPGDVNNRVMANDRIARLLSGELAVNMAGLVRVVFFAAVMVAYDAGLAAIGIVLSLVNLAALIYAARAREDMSRSLAKQQGLLAATAIGGIALIETLKSSGTERDYFRRFVGELAGYISAQQSLSFTSSLLQTLPTALTGLTNAAILGLGGLRVMHGAMTIGDVVAFQSLMSSFSEPMTGLIGFADQLQIVKGDVARLDDVVVYPVAPRLADTAAVIGTRVQDMDASGSGRLAGAIEMRGVSFGYSSLDPALLENIDLVVKPGQHVAIVGASGSGKSTTARLLTGLYQPWTGEILYDGLPLAEVSHQRLAASVGAVDQDIFLFEGSIRDNLALWDPSIDDADITSALRDTDMLEVVSSRPGGIASAVLEAGKNYSGGQQQRLEIARALVGNPSVLVLDEATSALDTAAESYIQERIRVRGATCVIIAHRLSTIRGCDEIIVLDQGRIVQRGTHDSLINVEGAYRRLLTAETEIRP